MRIYLIYSCLLSCELPGTVILWPYVLADYFWFFADSCWK